MFMRVLGLFSLCSLAPCVALAQKCSGYSLVERLPASKVLVDDGHTPVGAFQRDGYWHVVYTGGHVVIHDGGHSASYDLGYEVHEMGMLNLGDDRFLFTDLMGIFHHHDGRIDTIAGLLAVPPKALVRIDQNRFCSLEGRNTLACYMAMDSGGWQRYHVEENEEFAEAMKIARVQDLWVRVSFGNELIPSNGWVRSLPETVVGLDSIEECMAVLGVDEFVVIDTGTGASSSYPIDLEWPWSIRMTPGGVIAILSLEGDVLIYR